MENDTITKDMTTGNPVKLIMELAIPILLSNIFQQCYTITDSAIVGRGVGSPALAAVGATDWLNWMMSGSVIAFTTGFSVLAAQKFGAKDEKSLRKTIAMIIFLSVVVTVLFTAVSVFFMKDILQTLRTPEDIFDDAYSYISIIYLGAFAVMAFNAMAAVLRALGDSRTPLKAQILAAVINITLDLVFIYTLHFGIAGAAAATVTAQVTAVLYCFWVIRKQTFLLPHKDEWHIDFELIKKLLQLGLPLAARNFLAAVGGIIMQTVVNQYNVEVVAGYTITNKLYGCVTIASISYGYAFSSYVGQNYGAGRHKRIKDGFRSVIIISLVTSLLISMILAVFGRTIVSVFVTGNERYTEKILVIALRYLYRYAVFVIFLYIEAILSALLEGIGITNILFGVGVTGFLTRIILIELLPIHIGITGLFYPETAAWAAEALLLAAYCLRKRASLFN